VVIREDHHPFLKFRFWSLRKPYLGSEIESVI
jgi:hypothetical protein